MHLGNCDGENNSILENDRFREALPQLFRPTGLRDLRFSKTFLETIFSKGHPSGEF